MVKDVLALHSLAQKLRAKRHDLGSVAINQVTLFFFFCLFPFFLFLSLLLLFYPVTTRFKHVLQPLLLVLCATTSAPLPTRSVVEQMWHM